VVCLYTLLYLHRSTLFPSTTLFRSFNGEFTHTGGSFQQFAAEHYVLTHNGKFIVVEFAGFMQHMVRHHHLANVVQHGAHHRLVRSEEHTSELQSRESLVCRLLLEKK